MSFHDNITKKSEWRDKKFIKLYIIADTIAFIVDIVVIFVITYIYIFTAEIIAFLKLLMKSNIINSVIN